MTAIHEISRDALRVEDGSLYPALHRLEESGHLSAKWITKDTGRRARIYELTAAGKRQLQTEVSCWQAITAAIAQVLKEA
jgi:PadR family transcriptional regulator PadR